MTEKFEILSDKEHILRRPGMYIGSIEKEPRSCFISGQWETVEYVPGLIKICNEIIDNSIDEAIRTKFQYANQITVTVHENEITVTDNGRGIPQDKVKDLTGKEILRPAAAWTRAKSGTSFSDERETIGANGVGSALTNFFSHSFIGKTCDGSNTVIVTCSNNAERVFVKQVEGGERGTTVTFIPDFTRFGVYSISQDDIRILKDRIETLAVAFPEITFKFNKTRIPGGIKKHAALYNTNVVFEHENTCAFIAGSEEFKHNSFVNGVKTINAGSHVDYFMTKLTDELLPLIKKKHRIDVPKTMIKNGLTLGLFIRGFVNPKFDSQTKERLTNSQAEISPYLKDFPYDKMSKLILAEESIINPIIENLIAKQLAAENRELQKSQKKTRKVEGHIPCSTANGTLFLTEGKSAIGYLLKVRDPKKHGGYPLRGKVLNTWGMKPVKIMQNAELADLVSILGLTLGSDDISNMNYRDIAIMTDADVDGKGSIYPLLLAFFYNWKTLYTHGKIKFCKTPIVIATKGKDVKWFYDVETFNNAKLKNYDIRYIKGLGSLTEAEYKKVINEPVYDTVIIDNPECFDIMFGDDANKRKAWMTEEQK